MGKVLRVGKGPGEDKFGPFLAWAGSIPTLTPAVSARLWVRRENSAKGPGRPLETPACLCWPGKVLNLSGRVHEGMREGGRQAARPVSLNVLSGGGNGMEKLRRFLFHSAFHDCPRVLMTWELRSPGLKPIKAALGMGLRFHRMNTCASQLFNLQRVPPLLVCSFSHKHITKYFNVESHTHISTLWLALFKMQLWKVCF